jgi:hypothetical protein
LSIASVESSVVRPSTVEVPYQVVAHCWVLVIGIAKTAAVTSL